MPEEKQSSFFKYSLLVLLSTNCQYIAVLSSFFQGYESFAKPCRVAVVTQDTGTETGLGE